MQGILYQMHGNAMRDAAGLMAWRGYDNVRASELARAARMSVGTLYRMYGSKRAFTLAVRDFMDHELSNFGSHHFRWARSEPEGCFRSAFLVLWNELARVVVNQPALFCFTFLHWHPEDLQPPQARVTRARTLLRDVLTEGEREGALAPGAARVGEGLVWGALTERWRYSGDGIRGRRGAGGQLTRSGPRAHAGGWLHHGLREQVLRSVSGQSAPGSWTPHRSRSRSASIPAAPGMRSSPEPEAFHARVSSLLSHGSWQGSSFEPTALHARARRATPHAAPGCAPPANQRPSTLTDMWATPAPSPYVGGTSPGAVAHGNSLSVWNPARECRSRPRIRHVVTSLSARLCE